MDMSINQRLGQFMHEKGISQEELKLKLGLKNRQQVSNWINCHDHIPDKHLVAIIRTYPELNANWLIRDVGNMLNDQKTLQQINRNEFGFCEGCQDKQKEIDLLKIMYEKLKEELRNSYLDMGAAKATLKLYEAKAKQAE